MGEQPLAGSVDGDDVSFTIEISTQQGMFTLEFAATLADGELSGTMTAGGGQFSAPFTAVRKES